MKIECPTCNKVVKPDNGHRPFCGDRCRLIDLGDWLTGNFQIMEKEHAEVWAEPENSETRH